MSHPENTWKRTLFHLWWLNTLLGWPERVRGLHYWLGFEYALILDRMKLEPDSHVLDIGTGAYSIFPYLATHRFNARVTAIDIGSAIQRQADIRRSALRAGLCKPDQVQFLQADARSLPFLAETFDAVSIISVLEHIPNPREAGQALAEAARVLRPGGRVFMTVPYNHDGTIPEKDDNEDFFQWHYSAESLADFVLKPSGLLEIDRIYYGERLPFYNLGRKLPAPLDWLRRPLDTLLTAALLRPVSEPAQASAVFVVLEKSEL